MANPEHFEILMEGKNIWNKWRKENLDIYPDFRKADLSGADLRWTDLEEVDLAEANLQGADLSGAYLKRAHLYEANLQEAHLRKTGLSGSYLSRANLRRADLRQANLSKAHMRGATLEGAKLSGADLRQADLSHTNLSSAELDSAKLSKANLEGANLLWANLEGANLEGVNLRQANLSQANLERAKLRGANLFETELEETKLRQANLCQVDLRKAYLRHTNLQEADLSGANIEESHLLNTNLFQANLTNCRVYGTSVWDAQTDEATQQDLIITQETQPVITVDNLEIAQFIYLLIHNKKLRAVIDTLTTKTVLILGRFTEERKAVLDAIRNELRRRNYIPILFDFEKPATRDLTETVMTLASLSRFVVADLSDPNSIPHELMSFTEKLPSVPVMPLFCPTLEHPKPYPMLEHLQRYSHVLPTYFYDTEENLIAALPEAVIQPAEDRADIMRPGGIL